MLDALGNYGGPTQTHRLQAGSVAIDAGTNCVFDNTCSPALGFPLTTDQRGSPRRADGDSNGSATVDISSYEVDVTQSGSLFVVNTTDDLDDGACTSGHCSLREAINAANGNADTNTINFGAGVTGNLNLTGALPNLSTSMTIAGPGANVLTVRRDTGGDYRIFTVSGGTINVSGLTVSNGHLTGGFGAGINNSATLNLSECAITGNQASGGLHNFGGGLHNSGTATITRCTISGNSISGGSGNHLGGGIQNTGTLTLTNSTVSGNSSAGIGGGINVGGEGATAKLLTIVNSTISNNSEEEDFGCWLEQ